MKYAKVSNIFVYLESEILGNWGFFVMPKPCDGKLSCTVSRGGVLNTIFVKESGISLPYIAKKITNDLKMWKIKCNFAFH